MSLQEVDFSISSRTFFSTSAAGPMRQSTVARFIPLVRLYLSGTAASGALGRDNEEVLPPPQTNSGLQLVKTAPSTEVSFVSGDKSQEQGSPIMELRRLTGFTWDQLARLLGVVRRSLHFWASGKPLSAANEERLGRLLSAIRRLDRGSSSENRALLFREHSGLIPFDLLVEGRLDEAVELVGRGTGRRIIPGGELRAEAQKARKPLSPNQLIGALQDRAHHEVGRVRPAQIAKIKK